MPILLLEEAKEFLAEGSVTGVSAFRDQDNRLRIRVIWIEMLARQIIELLPASERLVKAPIKVDRRDTAAVIEELDPDPVRVHDPLQPMDFAVAEGSLFQPSDWPNLLNNTVLLTSCSVPHSTALNLALVLILLLPFAVVRILRVKQL